MDEGCGLGREQRLVARDSLSNIALILFQYRTKWGLPGCMHAPWVASRRLVQRRMSSKMMSELRGTSAGGEALGRGRAAEGGRYKGWALFWFSNCSAYVDRFRDWSRRTTQDVVVRCVFRKEKSVFRLF